MTTNLFVSWVFIVLLCVGLGFLLGWHFKPEPKLIDTSGSIVIRQDSSGIVSMRAQYQQLVFENTNLKLDNGAKDFTIHNMLSRNSELNKILDSMKALGETVQYLALDTLQHIHTQASVPIGGGRDSIVSMDIPVRTTLSYIPPPISYLSTETSIGNFSIPYFTREYRTTTTTQADTYGLWGMTGLSVQSYNPGVALGIGITDWYAKGTFSAREPTWEAGKTWRIFR